jgi:hypothetical protein
MSGIAEFDRRAAEITTYFIQSSSFMNGRAVGVCGCCGCYGSLSGGFVSTGHFTIKEDVKLLHLAETYPRLSWKEIGREIGRDARQARDRYTLHLRPKVNTTPWTSEEDELLRKKVVEFGPRWSLLMRFFPNRTNANVKNRWQTLSLRESLRPWRLPKQRKQSEIQPEMQSEMQPNNEAEFVMDTHIEEEPWFEYIYNEK